ncbi:hypothetical protein [Streptomyces hoynatensis]|uniref:Uncharacterized protein n=1 Tax=Streptomyces hoynatensis TaxID=1141874 RepID=A0A3A9Z9I9_9ACTN|nr:hypothetical protein [Streptomyces hoynatensis]RKN44819.1 hypothetical protein D7294_06770 [Streptomyces hoynatensis]
MNGKSTPPQGVVGWETIVVLKQEEVPIRNGYDIGIGVAMATGSPMALGAIGEVTPPQVGTGGSGSFVFRRIETTQDLETELGIGADVSAGIGLFSASASLEFSKKCKVQSSSLTVLVSAVERHAFQQMDSPTMSEAAGKLTEEGKPLEEKFGEYFVRGINTGGRFFGVVRIDTKSVQSKMELHAALEGSYGPVSGEVRVNISEAMRKAEAHADAFILHDGGRIQTLPHSNDPVELTSQLYQAMDEWSATVKEDPVPFTVTLAPYSIALGPPPPNIADIEKQRRVLSRCAMLRSQMTDMLNLVEYALDPRHADEFESAPDGPDLAALRVALVSDLDVIEESASFAIENLKEARDPETYMRDIRGNADFRLTTLPANMPKQKAVKPSPAPAANAMPNLVGQLAQPVLDLLACINLEDVDHCLKMFADSAKALGIDSRALGDFFFVVLRSGVKPDIQGDPNRTGARIKGQFPPPGIPVEPLTVMRIEIE